MRGGFSPPDPFILTEMPTGPAYRDTNGKTVRSLVINPAVKTLVLITAGQSNWESTNPTLYTPANSTVVDNFNIYDGAAYSIAGPLLGTTSSPLGAGNLGARVADLLITNGKFDRVILVPIAIGSTSVSDWGTGNLKDRVGVAMRRLAARGITPATTGVTFSLIWGQGENDTLAGTLQAAYTSSLNSFVSNAQAAGMSGRIFVTLESWNAGSTSSAVRAAQAAVVTGSVFQGGDMDTLNATNRQADNTHLNDTGAAAMATLQYNAMHASGAPF